MQIKHSVITAGEGAFTLDPNEIPALEKKVRELAIIGQPRALRALEMGSRIRGKGYNIFVTGASGTGRRSAVSITLNAFNQDGTPLRDIAYVYNFKEPERPKVLYFTPGMGNQFKKDLHQLVEKMKSEIKRRLEASDFKTQRDEILGVFEEAENRLIREFEDRISKEGLQIISVQEEGGQATDIAALIEGKPVTFAELHKMVAQGNFGEAEWKRLRDTYYLRMDEMKSIFSELKESRAVLEEELQALRIEAVKPAILGEIGKLSARYEEENIRLYLTQLGEDFLENIYLFLMDTPFIDESGNPRLIRYGVNVIEDRSSALSFPSVWENHPSYPNLFGNIDVRIEKGGEGHSNFMMIQAGSIIHASGGFLIIDAEELLREEGSWYHLKRTLQSGKVEIQHRQSGGQWGGNLLKPEPIKVNVKIILIGPEGMYDALYREDPEFKKHFKIHADFSSRMERTAEGMAQYLGFVRNLAAEENLMGTDPGGICALIEEGVRLTGDRTKLSTRFSTIADLIREADYWAGKSGKTGIDRESVLLAIKEKAYLANRVEAELDEMMLQGDLLVKVEGKERGVVNGLAIHDNGYYRFGRTSVISARVAPGERGLVNIEREAGLSGEIHNKGILILEGFLRGAYAKTFPLSIHASICFEQSYNQIDGDSASSTEIYALLSAISGVPLRQDIGVTGSVNQLGEIQPVGGITEKVEGFFRICKKMGLQGMEGVLIPRQNRRNLMLSDEVVKAIADGSFTVYTVDHINEGIEILTGMEAGERVKGKYPEKSLNRMVEDRLVEMAEQVRRYHSGS